MHRAAPMTEVVGRGTSRERFALVLMAAFAGVSLLLAAIGLYGVLAYAVRQRTQEIGVRIALGATGRQIRLTVLRQASIVLGRGSPGRHRRCACARTLADVARFWNQPFGPSNHCGRRGAPYDDGPARGVATRTARRARRAKVRHAGRLERFSERYFQLVPRSPFRFPVRGGRRIRSRDVEPATVFTTLWCYSVGENAL